MDVKFARPLIAQYQDPVEFFRDMLNFRKKVESSFSVSREAKKLRRVSSALVSLIVSGRRKMTQDRVDELTKLMNLTVQEKYFFKDWVRRLESPDSVKPQMPAIRRRKQSTSHLLTDWINVYVKDAFQIKKVRSDVNELYRLLSGIASESRINKSLGFLLSAGYLAKNALGQIVVDTPLHSIDQRIPDEKIREFHKGALKIAAQAIDQYPTSKRYANAMVLPLDARRYQELQGLIDEFADKLQEFAESTNDGDALYQVLINLSPTGGVND